MAQPAGSSGFSLASQCYGNALSNSRPLLHGAHSNFWSPRVVSSRGAAGSNRLTQAGRQGGGYPLASRHGLSK
eukprot:6047490-Pyramimonas_sp.AAC.1